MGLRASRLRWPEWLIGGGGALLLVAMLLMPWYTLTLTSGPPGPQYFIPQPVDGWHGLTVGRWVLLLTVLAALGTAFFQAQRRAPALPATLTVLAGILAAVSTLWLIVRVLIDPPGGRGIGGWIALLASAAIAYGAYASARMEGVAREDGPTEIPTIDLAGQPSR
jgi:hypothetical protein